MSFADTILDLLAEPPRRTDPAGLDRNEQVLLHLVDAARSEAGVAAPADLRAWIEGVDDDDDASAEVDHSLVAAEMVEGWIDRLPAPAEQLAAAGDDDRAAGTAPFPASYSGGGWTLTVGIEEQGRLYLAVDAAPATGDLEVHLDGLDAPVVLAAQPGAAVILGNPADVLGAPPDFNPWSRLRLRLGEHEVELRRAP